MRPSATYTVCPILESAVYCHHRSHCKGIPPNAIYIALSSVGSRVPATEPQWQIKWVHQWGLNACLQLETAMGMSLISLLREAFKKFLQKSWFLTWMDPPLKLAVKFLKIFNPVFYSDGFYTLQNRC